MSDKHYTSEVSTQCLVALLKEYGIKKIIASPGTTNHVFVGSVQSDPWFEVYSSVDERSAAYLACGMASETGEQVVITCTGATASRNYLSGLTEAFYRKLPIIAVTYNAGVQQKGHLIAQQINRDRIQEDVARCAVNIPMVRDESDHWFVNVEINKALLATRHKGGGPVHINISTGYSRDFSVEKLPKERVISRIGFGDEMPALISKKTAVFIVSHKNFTEEETEAVDIFCHAYNAVVFCDHTSGYFGKYHIQSSLIGAQALNDTFKGIDLLIHIGEVSGDYYSIVRPAKVWRVSEDGEIRDTFHVLTHIFEMPSANFFRYYAELVDSSDNDIFLQKSKTEYTQIETSIPELPFSNVWIAQHTAPRIPVNSVVHLGILNSLRAWNFFPFPDGVESNCNVGGFGIDGILSTVVGAAIARPEKIFFAVVGDLAFFYDLNSLGNRHRPENLRILLINNGRGTEFTNFNHPCYHFGEAAVPYMAAGGHFGCKSPELVMHFASDLGYTYLTAHDKESYTRELARFIDSNAKGPIIFEVFTEPKDESDAIEAIHNITAQPDGGMSLFAMIKSGTKRIIGEKGRKIINIIRE